MIYHSVERIRLQHVEQIPVNRVRALQLQADLQAEYGKEAWKQAEARAWARWKSEGGRVVRLAPGCNPQPRRGGYYVDEV